jgi:predicted PurR-regulated permease PerM
MNFLKRRKMKKIIVFVFILILSFGASTVFAAMTDPKSSSDKLAFPDKTENKLSEAELSRLTRRVEEIRDMDKSAMTVKEKREIRKELKGIKENVRRSDGTVVIGVTTLLLIIILVILLV